MTTLTTIALTELAAKGADADFIKQTLQFALQRLMEMDVEALCKAAYGERSEERANSRNGYRERVLETRAGTVGLKIPKLRAGSYFPDFLEARGTAKEALTSVIQEAYTQVISTRSLDELVEAMGMTSVQEPGVAPVRSDRRTRTSLPAASPRGRLALSVDRCHLRQNSAGRKSCPWP